MVYPTPDARMPCLEILPRCSLDLNSLSIVHGLSGPFNMVLPACLRGVPSWPSRPFVQIRPASTRLCSHRWRYLRPARLCLQRYPRRRDSGGESGRKRACRGRDSVYIALPRHVSLHSIDPTRQDFIRVPYRPRTGPDTTNYHSVHSAALGAAGVLGCQTSGRRSRIARSKK
jgi:hypothetical protein